MDDLAECARHWIVDAQDAWSQDDLDDAVRFSRLHVGQTVGNGDTDGESR